MAEVLLVHHQLAPGTSRTYPAFATTTLSTHHSPSHMVLHVEEVVVATRVEVEGPEALVMANG
jgi:hypothetical protein